jgi:HAD superfamily hydrolase (TIGR01509 family)
MIRPLQAILFDLGDTLLDFGPIEVPKLFNRGAGLAWEYLRDAHLPLPGFRWYRFRHLLAIRVYVLRSRLTNREFNCLDLLARIARQMGIPLTPQQCYRLCELWYQPLREQATVAPGTAEFLAELAPRGLDVALLSNTFIPGDILDGHLREIGLLDCLPTRIYSCDVGWRKPHSRIFRHALSRLGNPEPRQCLFVGDKLRADVLGANRLGMRTALKAPQGSRSWPGLRPDHHVRTIPDLRDILDGYGNVLHKSPQT